MQGREQNIVHAGLMPHPPILVPLVGRGREELASKTLEAMRRLSRRIVEIAPEILLLISPHAPRQPASFGVWTDARVEGDLGRFGAPQAGVSLPNHPAFSRRLQEVLTSHGVPAWSIRNQPLDHGAVVPLWFLAEAGWTGPTVVMGLNYSGEGMLADVGNAIAETIRLVGRRTAIIASGDMSHRLIEGAPGGYHRRAAEFDRTFIDFVDEGRLGDLPMMDPELVELAGQDVLESSVIACAAIGFRTRTAEVLSYQGPFGVGYGVATFHDGLKAEDLVDSHDAGEILVTTARRAVERYVLTGDRITLDPDIDARMPRRHGIFVTIRRHDGELRGCMGSIGPVERLFTETVDNAISSAVRDPRFPPITPEELPDIEFEVSLLHEPEQVDDIAQLDPARYGVIMRELHGKSRAILLPAIEGLDTVEKQLDAVRRKAGIPPGEAVVLHRFSVDKFAETGARHPSRG